MAQNPLRKRWALTLGIGESESLAGNFSENRRRRKEVGILIETEDSWGRRITAGIVKAVREHYPWRLSVSPYDDYWQLRLPENWPGQGIICAIRDDLTAKHVQDLKLPVVNVSTWGRHLAWASHVVTSDVHRAELAFTHLRSKGFQRFAFYAPPSLPHLQHRGKQFGSLVKAAGFEFEDYCTFLSTHPSSDKDDSIARWLKHLMPPTAILAGNPHPAMKLSERCAELGIRIPHEIGILSCDSDDLICEISEPPISSVDLACERLAATAVAKLDELMTTGSLGIGQVEYIEPIRIIERRSTAAMAFSDPLFAQAVEYLRTHALDGISVSDILHKVPICRRSLEQQFNKLLGTSPAAEIRRLRIDAVKTLLLNESVGIVEIVRATGFGNTSQLCKTFRREVGLTPTEFRRLHE
jgi:LacI family transcriptional regulator